MRRNPFSRKDNATGLGLGLFLLLILSPIWLVILIGVFFPILVAMFILAIPVGVIYVAVRK